VLYGVDRSTISTAVRQVRPLLANRGFATPAGQRLHTLADVLAYAAAEGLTVRLDGTEIQVRRPKANRPGRRAFVSGKRKQNTIKATVASDANGRPMWAGAIRPGRQHDQTAVRTEGIDDLLDAYPDVTFLVDSGYRGLANDHPDQVIAPPLKPRKDAPPKEIAAYETARKTQSSQRIPAEHAIAAIKWWRTLQRFTGRRDVLPETIRTITGLAATAPQPDEPTTTPNSIDPQVVRTPADFSPCRRPGWGGAGGDSGRGRLPLAPGHHRVGARKSSVLVESSQSLSCSMPCRVSGGHRP